MRISEWGMKLIAECGMRIAECGMNRLFKVRRSTFKVPFNCGLRNLSNAECGVRNAESLQCGLRNEADWRVRNAECGMRNEDDCGMNTIAGAGG